MGATKEQAHTGAQAGLRSRAFWLGVVAAACVLGPVAAIAALGGGDPEQPGDAASALEAERRAEFEREAARYSRENQVRNREQVNELTERMRGLSSDLDPVVAGLARTLPPGDEAQVGPLAPAARVREWAGTARAAATYFDEVPSGETGTNVARGAFEVAVRGVREAVESYRLAVEGGPLRRKLLARARAQRDLALRAWETAAVQIDVINIAVGYGHQHVAVPGREGNAPDSFEEGAEATQAGE